MPGRPTLQELLEVQQYFGLPSPALVEKDWYVVNALAAINALDVAPFRLVFGGGTALSRAHGLTRRMSEDIDLRIVADHEPSRSELRGLREKVTNALLAAGFSFDPKNPSHRASGNEGRYTIYQLPYSTETGGDGALRPEVMIETSVWPLRLEPITCTVASFCAEAFKEPPEIPAITCVSLTETLAEKFVALTRRAGEEIANGEAERDRTLVRHIYDLHVTRPNYDAAELIGLAAMIVHADAKAYGGRFPAYREDPVRETLKAVDALASDGYFADHYADFLRDMVYGDRPDFSAALTTIEGLAEKLRTSS